MKKRSILLLLIYMFYGKKMNSTTVDLYILCKMVNSTTVDLIFYVKKVNKVL